MNSGARLWLLEKVLPLEDHIQLRDALFDLLMLTLVGGIQRTAAEYEALLTAAGFTGIALVSTETGYCVVEAVCS